MTSPTKEARANSMGSSSSSGSEKKQSRIDKELLLLRNLAPSFKMNRKTTSLGIVIYVSCLSFSQDEA